MNRNITVRQRKGRHFIFKSNMHKNFHEENSID